MKVLRIRVTIDEEEDIYRDIDIKLSQSLEDLHYAILKAYAFDTIESASFYNCNNSWEKGKEFVLKKEDAKNGQTLMKDAVLSKIVYDPHQKFIYIYDYNVKWFFYCEIIKIVDDNSVTDYPFCSKSYGVAPRQRPVAQIKDEENNKPGDIDSDLDKMLQSVDGLLGKEEPDDEDIENIENDLEDDSEEDEGEDEEMFGFDDEDLEGLNERDNLDE